MREQIAAAHLLIVLSIKLPPARLGKGCGFEQNSARRQGSGFRSHDITKGNQRGKARAAHDTDERSPVRTHVHLSA